MIPKSFIIVLLENHHFIDVDQLDSYQRSRLSRIYKQGGGTESESRASSLSSSDRSFDDKTGAREKLNSIVTNELERQDSQQLVLSD